MVIQTAILSIRRVAGRNYPLTAPPMTPTDSALELEDDPEEELLEEELAP